MPQEQAWNHLVREVCRALAKRDALPRRGEGGPERAEDWRQRRFWQAQARARLRELGELAERMPRPAVARETLAELEEWAASEPANEAV